MIKRILTLAVLGAAFISTTGCKNDGGFKKTQGISYKIIKDAPGPTAKIGDYIELNVLIKVDTMVIMDSRKNQTGEPVGAPVQAAKENGDIQAVFPMLSAGDSVVVEVSCDTLLKNFEKSKRQPNLPPWFKKGKKITYYLSVVSIKSMDDYRKEMEAKQAKMMQDMKAKEAAQAPIDDKLLQDYLAKNNIKAQKTASGLYYTIAKPGSGENPKAGQDVTMKYLGKTLEGKQFDANMDESYNYLPGKTPFTFVIGQHQVIGGWDEGVALLKKGARATLYIPSPLAYGAQSPSQDVPPNSILVFNVEVVDIKAHTEPKQPTMQAPPTH